MFVDLLQLINRLICRFMAANRILTPNDAPPEGQEQ